MVTPQAAAHQTTSEKLKTPALDAKAEHRFASDLEKIRKHAPFIDFMGSDYLFKSGTSNPANAHTIAGLVTSKAFQGLDKFNQDFIFHTALALGQNYTKESVVKLKNLVTTTSFATASPTKQIDMLNNFLDNLEPKKKK